MKLPPFVFFSLACSIVFGLWVVYAIFIYCNFGGVTNAGIFGDMFGGFSAIMSALGFGAVATTLWIQLNQIEEERIARRESDERQAKQFELMQRQVEILNDQHIAETKRFEKSIDPAFQFLAHSRNSTMSVIRVRNIGGRLIALSVQSRGNRVQLKGNADISKGDNGTLEISPPRKENETIQFSFTFIRTGDDSTQTRNFQLTDSGVVKMVEDSEKNDLGGSQTGSRLKGVLSKGAGVES